MGPIAYSLCDSPILAELGSDYVGQLAELLHLREGAEPNHTWLDEQLSTLNSGTEVHPPLLRRRFLPRSLTRVIPRVAVSLYPSLGCSAHKKLDPIVLTECARLLREEVGLRNDKHRAHVAALDYDLARRPPPHPDMPMVERVRAVCAILAGAARLWMTSADWDKFYGPASFYRTVCTSADGELRKLPRVESHCPACMLAVVGGRREVLMALRASLNSREDNRGLLCLVEAFIQQLPLEDAQRVRNESDELASVLRVGLPKVWF